MVRYAKKYLDNRDFTVKNKSLLSKLRFYFQGKVIHESGEFPLKIIMEELDFLSSYAA